MPTESEMRYRRDSWPPTQVRLTKSSSIKSETHPPSLDDIDENPLTYFLSSTANDHQDYFMAGADDEDMDFDAGIEDASQPRQIVRSVSPSSLEGLAKPKHYRPVSPDLDSDGLSADDDDDFYDEDEDYIRFSPSGLSPLRDLAIDSLRFRPRSPVFGRSANALLSPSAFPSSPSRGRTSFRHRGGQSRSLSARYRANRLAREPSPDVWSIQEETEEDMLSEMENSQVSGSAVYTGKPKKKVRFVLPGKQ